MTASGENKVYVYIMLSQNKSSEGFVYVFVNTNNHKTIVESNEMSDMQGSDSILRANIFAIKRIEDSIGFNSENVIFLTDSHYLFQGVTKWVPSWINPPKGKKAWTTSKGKPVKNRHLWLELLNISKNYNIQWAWIDAYQDDETIIHDMKIVAQRELAKLSGDLNIVKNSKNSEDDQPAITTTSDHKKEVDVNDLIDAMMSDKFLKIEEITRGHEQGTINLENSVTIHFESPLWQHNDRNVIEALEKVIDDAFGSLKTKYTIKQSIMMHDAMFVEITLWIEQYAEIEAIIDNINDSISATATNWRIRLDKIFSFIGPDWVNIHVAIEEVEGNV